MNIDLAPSSRQATGITLVVLSAILTAVVPTAAKLALEAGATTLTVLSARGLIAVVVLSLAMLVTGQRFAIGRGALMACLLAGVAYLFMAYGYIGSVAYIPVSLAVLIYFTHPLLLALIAHLRGTERLNGRKIGLAIAVLLGLTLAIGPELAVLDPLGIALATLASVAVCGLILFAVEAQKGASSIQIMVYSGVITSVFFSAVTTGLGAWSMPVSTLGWIGLLLAGLGSALGLLAFFAAFRYISPVRATMISNLEPLLGVLIAVAVLGEHLGGWQWLGVGVVVAGLVLFEKACGKE
jgi:drug/metabolite transporter (DMT)-like permease